MRPGPTDSAVLAGGELVGYLDEREFQRETLATDAALRAAVAAGLFAPGDVVRFEVLHRFESAAGLLEDVSGWRSTLVPRDVAEGVERGRPPFDVRERCFVERLRAL